MMENIFVGKVAVITGSASGIGRATAEEFARRGAKVVMVDINREGGEKIANSIKESGVEASFYQVDTSNETQVNDMAKQVVEKYGGVDYLVNSAGIEINDVGNILTMPTKDLIKILAIDLLGYIWCVRALAPGIHKGGSIVNVTSVQGLSVHRPGTSYQVAKSGIIGLTRSLAVEVAELGIRVNAIAPGAIATEGMGKVRAGTGVLDPYRRIIPMGRRGSAAEIGRSIVAMCSDDFSYMTGSVVVVDGGYLTNITPAGDGKIQYLDDDPDL